MAPGLFLLENCTAKNDSQYLFEHRRRGSDTKRTIIYGRVQRHSGQVLLSNN